MSDSAFDVHRALTEADIQAARNKEKRVKHFFEGTGLGAALLLVCVIYFGVPDLFIAVTMAVCIVSLGIRCFVFEDISSYTDVRDAMCDELLSACMATEEGQAYRREVLKQGRKFVYGEYFALLRWAAGQKTRDSCKQLYDIPTA